MRRLDKRLFSTSSKSSVVIVSFSLVLAGTLSS